MEDIITKYKKQRKIKTIWIIVTSLLLAISLNVFISTSDMWKTIKSSVLESSSTKNDLSDLYLTSDSNILTLKASKEMKEVKNVSFSFLYNPENIELKDKLLWDYNWSIIELAVEKWQYTLTLEFDSPTDILPWKDLFKIVMNKNSSVVENINLAQANFIDKNDDSFTLTTSWIQY